MPGTTPLTFRMPTEGFDVSLLPTDAREPGTARFRQAVKRYLEEEFGRLGGWRAVQVDDQTIEVSWTPHGGAPDPVDQVIEKLKRGEYQGAITLLELFLSDRPADVNLLYNLGMALSEVGRLPEAEACLRRAIELAPTYTNAVVALGVALIRQEKNDAAIEVFRRAVQQSPDNLWAHRNLGACLARAGAFQDAEIHLRTGTEIAPRDQQSWYGLGQVLERLDRIVDADDAYRHVIDIDEYSQMAQGARDALGSIAHREFRSRTGSTERPDAVMYCLGALERFEALPRGEVQRIAFEIAILGQRGLDVNDSARKYRLKSLPGQFSALHLVCLMYVGFKLVASEQDIGFDLSAEYAVAQALHEQKRSR